MCVVFCEIQQKDTEIRPGVSDRKGLEKMMPALSLETQIGVSFQMENWRKHIQRLLKDGKVFGVGNRRKGCWERGDLMLERP